MLHFRRPDPTSRCPSCRGTRAPTAWALAYRWRLIGQQEQTDTDCRILERALPGRGRDVVEEGGLRWRPVLCEALQDRVVGPYVACPHAWQIKLETP
jgi:hypothetical protein